MAEHPDQFGRTQLVCACGEAYLAGFDFEKLVPREGFGMQKHAGKIRLEAADCTPSDGYYVLITLISVVAATTAIILLGFGIETLI